MQTSSLLQDPIRQDRIIKSRDEGLHQRQSVLGALVGQSQLCRRIAASRDTHHTSERAEDVKKEKIRVRAAAVLYGPRAAPRTFTTKTVIEERLALPAEVGPPVHPTRLQCLKPVIVEGVGNRVIGEGVLTPSHNAEVQKAALRITLVFPLPPRGRWLPELRRRPARHTSVRKLTREPTKESETIPETFLTYLYGPTGRSKSARVG
ncbi:hypothetical protein FISHEDRAFT_61101 [Fistulina hepatica ATCC 64428]|uniref:Uncharacterized protein n=1 Tax=Fistulina hepatica ATCC 64428 TaxID=1128425 RepID=A0A0D7A642_9AGAR|nr:hypothetical protein FISHEDRAFT_61101 [Fistulina hepatica ATCC 64428]